MLCRMRWIEGGTAHLVLWSDPSCVYGVVRRRGVVGCSCCYWMALLIVSSQDVDSIVLVDVASLSLFLERGAATSREFCNGFLRTSVCVCPPPPFPQQKGSFLR